MAAILSEGGGGGGGVGWLNNQFVLKIGVRVCVCVSVGYLHDLCNQIWSEVQWSFNIFIF